MKTWQAKRSKRKNAKKNLKTKQKRLCASAEFLITRLDGASFCEKVFGGVCTNKTKQL